MALPLRSVSRRLVVALAPAAAALALVAVGSTNVAAHTLPVPPPSTPQVATWEYLPGVEADFYRPLRPRPHAVPLVVMIPGGGWQTADRTGLGQLAAALAAQGIAATTATYRVGQVSSRFPVPVQDISCAIDASVAAAKRAGLRPDPVVVLGHSAGAHLSSLAVFGAPSFRTAQCPYPRAPVDGWVGLSGVYDLTIVGQWSWTMMGGTAQDLPELYAQAGTATYVPTAPRNIDALVVQGDSDELLISTSIATDLADLLRRYRFETQLTIIPGADHQATYQAPVIGGTLMSWLRQVEPR